MPLLSLISDRRPNRSFGQSIYSSKLKIIALSTKQSLLYVRMRYTLGMDVCSRQSLPNYIDALNHLLSVCLPLTPVKRDLMSALGLTLANDVMADRDQPPFDRSAMDGFAMSASDIQPGCQLSITGMVAAGASPEHYQTPVEQGCAYRIATGAPLPVGADVVIPIELAKVSQTEPATVSFEIDTVEPWKNIHRQGVDAHAGDKVIPAGTVLRPHHIAIAAAVGQVQLDVVPKPRVTLLTTGDEVRPPQTPTDQLQPQQIRNSNGPLVVALLSNLGVADVTHIHLPDEPEPTLDAAQNALQTSDLVLSVGGVSVGQRDHLPATWEKLGVTKLIHGVAIKPGKPVFAAHQDQCIIVGLPGNPVSVLASFHLFVWPVICQLTQQAQPHWQEVVLDRPAKAHPTRDQFRLVRLSDQNASIIGWQGSGDLMHTASADGFAWLPVGALGCETGQKVRFLPLVQ
ncbi:MAG: molybdopterin molybdenumtransferase MoeA [Phycisphaeraceae bacterium]|nr:molybdopterin molybdenumtransferase MoeA [Phycisphaeraceae bacterium]